MDAIPAPFIATSAETCTQKNACPRCMRKEFHSAAGGSNVAGRALAITLGPGPHVAARPGSPLPMPSKRIVRANFELPVLMLWTAHGQEGAKDVGVSGPVGE